MMSMVGKWPRALAIGASVLLAACHGTGSGGPTPPPTAGGIITMVVFHVGAPGIQCTGNVNIAYTPPPGATGPGTKQLSFTGISDVGTNTCQVVDTETGLAFGTWTITVAGAGSCQRQVSAQSSPASATFNIGAQGCS
jgi:hypothetical protein